MDSNRSLVLDLRGKGVNHELVLPDAESLSSIIALDLSINALKHLPPFPTNRLPNLRELRLDSNQLTTGTFDGLRSFSMLTSLSLQSNMLASCHDFGCLDGLQTLKLNQNQISDVRGLAKLTNLTALDLSNNKIRKLQGLSSLLRLEELVLDSNQLTSLDGLSKCTALRELTFNNNRVANLAGLSTLTGLDVLRLDGNKVEGLESLPSLPELTELHAGRNRLSSLEGLADKLPFLEILDVRANRLDGQESCLRALSSLAGLAELTLQGCPFCNNFESTRLFRTRVREQLPSLSYLDGSPISQLDDALKKPGETTRESAMRESTSESSQELRAKWEASDDPFAPSLEEMEAFKKKMGIHPNIDPFGRPSTAKQRRSSESATGSYSEGRDHGREQEEEAARFEGREKNGTAESERDKERPATIDRAEVEETTHAEETGSSESNGEDDRRDLAARARQRHVLRVESALGDLNERLTSYHSHVTSVIEKLRVRLAPTLEAAQAASMDNGFLVMATQALPAVPQIDLETPPSSSSGEQHEASDKRSEGSRTEEPSSSFADSSTTPHPFPKRRSKANGQSTLEEPRVSVPEVETRRKGRPGSKRDVQNEEGEDEGLSSRFENVIGQPERSVASKVTTRVTAGASLQATRSLPRGTLRPRSERLLLKRDDTHVLQQAALTERGRRDKANGVHEASSVDEAVAHKIPKAAWLEGSDPAQSNGNASDKAQASEGPLERAKVGPSVREHLEARPAKEALDLFYKMFPDAVQNQRGSSAEKENAAERSRKRLSLRATREGLSASQVAEKRSARTAPAALRPEAGFVGIGKERAESRVTALHSRSNYMSLKSQERAASKDEPLKLPLIPLKGAVS